MIDLADVTLRDIGRWVVYGPRGPRGPIANPFGRIKSWNQKFIFVVYQCAGNWEDFASYTGVATAPGDLEFRE